MFEIELTYNDFNDEPHREKFYFNMMAPEITDLNFNPEFGEGGLKDYMQTEIRSGDGRRIHTVFKLLIVNSFGRRSDDGKRFIKRPEYTEEFLNSRAWEQFFLWLTDDADGAKNSQAYWEGIIPAEMRDKADAIAAQSTGKRKLTELTREELQALYLKEVAGKAAQGEITTTPSFGG